MDTKDEVKVIHDSSARPARNIDLHTYTASLAGISAPMPIIASAIAVAIYMANITAKNSGVSLFLPLLPEPLGGTSLLLSTLITLVLWLVAAFPFRYLATAEGANARNYGLLRNHLNHLGAQLKVAHDVKQGDPNAPDSDSYSALNALAEAQACYDYIDAKLEGAGLRWLFGMEYIILWNNIHRAEQAFLQFGPCESIVSEALGDLLRISGSEIKASNVLLKNLTRAVNVLNPSALHYFDAVSVSPNTQLNDASGQTGKLGATGQEAQARSMLRQVRKALNEFEDERWEGLLRSRNQLLAAIAICGMVTYLLVALALINSTNTTNISPLVAAVTFYVTGSIAGLFGWLYQGSRVSMLVDDYGLSLVRMVSTPLLSGLAGVASVFITVLFYGSLLFPEGASGTPLLCSTIGPSGHCATLNDIFYLDPRYLLSAALFGLVPSLVIGTLLQRSLQYVSDLNSVKPAEAGVF